MQTFDAPVLRFKAVPGELNTIMAITGFFIVTYYVTVGAPLAGFAHSAAESLF